MAGKAELTKKFMIETVAPLFNKYGYVGTSMSQITTATGLTKGAIYGNFENKENLAIESFNYNIRLMILPLADRINAKNGSQEKLRAITDYYREYYSKIMKHGGCPVLNVGMDTIQQDSPLRQRVVSVMGRLVDSIATILDEGKKSGEFKKDIETELVAMRIFSIIQGAIFAASMTQKRKELKNMMDFLDQMIEQNIVI